MYVVAEYCKYHFLLASVHFFTGFAYCKYREETLLFIADSGMSVFLSINRILKFSNRLFYMVDRLGMLDTLLWNIAIDYVAISIFVVFNEQRRITQTEL